MNRIRLVTSVTALFALLLLSANQLAAQKYGGIVQAMARGNPPSLSIHDEATFNTAWPMGSVYNNLIHFDWFRPIEKQETIVSELATGWRWNKAYTQLTFDLHRGVKWHDGKPFTAADVKHTFDVVRGTSSQKTKLNPRKLWFANVKDITTSGDYRVTFVLKRPQPSLEIMLASGYAVIYAAHVPVRDLRTTAMGTGPFTLAKYDRDSMLQMRKNPNYYVRGRPYLDGIDFVVIKSKATRLAAMQSGQLDVAAPTETDQNAYNLLKVKVPGMRFQKSYLASNVNIVINNQKPPFNNTKLRRAVNLAIDRRAYTRSVQPGYAVGTFMLPPPYGVWGLLEKDLGRVPGYRDPARDKEDGRRLMRELGYSDSKRLKIKLSTRGTANYKDAAVWALSELKEIYFDAELDVVETGNWHGRMARRDYTIALNATGLGADDPDVGYFENFSCGSQRNYSDYCNKEAEKLFAEQSSTIDQEQRLKLVHRIEKMLVNDVARISLGFRVNYHAHQEYVHNFVGHQTHFGYARFQEVWLDK